MLASDLPDKMAIPSVTIEATATEVKVQWVQPGFHASPIDAYEILLQKLDGSFSTETTSCDGSDSTIRG